MEFGLLGPILIDGQDCTALLAAAKPRKVLALLLLYANQVVPVTAIMTELWDTTAPRSAQTTVQTYILRLRKLLATVAGCSPQQVSRELLKTKSSGYLLQVGPGALDLHRFDQFSAKGRRALSVGDNESAARLLDEALECWRGPALVDVPAGQLLDAQVTRLTESRLTALQQRIEAKLRLGYHHELLGEISALTTEHPLHENLHAQLMLALYRCGRRPDALEVFHRLRNDLINELGLEPSAKMQRLHQAILVADPVLDGPQRADGLAVDYIFRLGQLV